MVEIIPFGNTDLVVAYPWISGSLLEELAVEVPESGHFLADQSDINVSLDEYLFREGELKTNVYRLETGIICITAARASGPPEIIETVFPGNLLGLGFLKRNIHNAKAVVESRVSCWALSDIPALVEENATAQRRQAEATEREFAYRRSAMIRLTEDSPVQRLAAFLIAVSRLNEVEGRDTNVISDLLHCGVVAKYLGMDIDTLSNALIELEARALVEQSPTGGLRLCDREKLDGITPTAWQMCGVG